MKKYAILVIKDNHSVLCRMQKVLQLGHVPNRNKLIVSNKNVFFNEP